MSWAKWPPSSLRCESDRASHNTRISPTPLSYTFIHLTLIHICYAQSQGEVEAALRDRERYRIELQTQNVANMEAKDVQGLNGACMSLCSPSEFALFGGFHNNTPNTPFRAEGQAKSNRERPGESEGRVVESVGRLVLGMANNDEVSCSPLRQPSTYSIFELQPNI